LEDIVLRVRTISTIEITLVPAFLKRNKAMILLGKLLLVLLLAVVAYSESPNAVDNFIGGDPLNEIEKSLTLSPEDVYDTPTSTPLSTELVQDERSIDNMSFSDVTWMSSHNAHANEFAAADNVFRKLASNQEQSVYKQLKQGVRGLMLDIEYKDGSLQCVHGFVEFGLLRYLVVNEIIPFLNEEEQCVITIDFETKGDVELIRNEMRDLFEAAADLSSRTWDSNTF
jgi:hypothetical protein